MPRFSPNPASHDVLKLCCVKTFIEPQMWTFRGLNPGPHACEACALPLCQMPLGCRERLLTSPLRPSTDRRGHRRHQTCSDRHFSVPSCRDKDRLDRMSEEDSPADFCYCALPSDTSGWRVPAEYSSCKLRHRDGHVFHCVT